LLKQRQLHFSYLPFYFSPFILPEKQYFFRVICFLEESSIQ
jgi:hypothetical protein